MNKINIPSLQEFFYEEPSEIREYYKYQAEYKFYCPALEKTALVHSHLISSFRELTDEEIVGLIENHLKRSGIWYTNLVINSIKKI